MLINMNILITTDKHNGMIHAWRDISFELVLYITLYSGVYNDRLRHNLDTKSLLLKLMKEHLRQQKAP
jgi:hypothetical protein